MIRALTLDLDDTVWPFAPVAERIARALEQFLAEHAPRTAARYDRAGAMDVLAEVKRDRLDLAHDLPEARRESLRRMLLSCDEDPALADGAFAAVMEQRQRVEHHPDAAPALDRIATRMPILAVTNGNADPERTGVARWLSGVVASGAAGVSKPDPRIFAIACERLGLPPADVLHAGDSVDLDVRGALDAGLQAAWVRRDHPGEPVEGALVVDDLLGLADALGA